MGYSIFIKTPLAVQLEAFLNYEMTSPQELLKLDIHGEKNQVNQKIYIAQQTISNFKRAVNKMRKKKEGENILQNFIKIQIKQQEDSLQDFHNKIKMCDDMLEILNDYEYGDVTVEVLQVLNSMQQENT